MSANLGQDLPRFVCILIDTFHVYSAEPILFLFFLQLIESRFVNSFITVHVNSEFYFVFRLLFVKHLLTNFNSLSFKISFDSMPIYNSAYSMLRI